MRLALLSAVILGLAYISSLVKTEIDNRVQLQSLMASLERIENERRGNQAATFQDLKDQNDATQTNHGTEVDPVTTEATSDWMVVKQNESAEEEPSSKPAPDIFVGSSNDGKPEVAVGTGQAANVAAMATEGDVFSSHRHVDELFSAPDFTLTRLSDGNATSPLMEQDGRIIVLDFWATWCLPCLKELPKLAELFEQYDPAEVRFIAVNAEESRETIDAYTERHPLKIEIASDRNGKAAEAFGIEDLPSLIIIDSDGKVQRLYVGFQEGLLERVKTEIDALLAGETLQGDPRIAAQLYESRSALAGSAKQNPRSSEFKPNNRHTQDFELSLSNGESVKVAEKFEKAKSAFEELLSRTEQNNPGRLTKIPVTGGNEPALILSSRGRNLHGPLASYGDDGKALAYVQYQFGRRTGTLLSWDESGRPLTLEEYKGGRKDGLTCLFKSCGGQCMSGHLWLAQEWEEGELRASHIALQNGSIRTLRQSGSTAPRPDPETYLECGMALREIQTFEDRLAKDERKIKEAVSAHYTKVRQTLFAEVRARMEARNVRSFSLPIGMLGNSTSFASSFPSTPGFSMGSMRIRNCGSS